MLLTTTNNIEGKKITQYYGIVSGETIIGANVFKDFFADYFPRNVLATVGMENVEWYNCPQTSNGSDEHRKAFLSMIYDKI